MRLEDAKAAYEEFSGKASDIVRQISLAGIGLIWIFKSVGQTVPYTLAPALLRAALFIFLALVFDFLQYILGTSIWFIYFRHKEKQGTSESAQFLAPRQLNWPIWTLFFLKSLMMLVAYCWYIIPFLISQFQH